MTRGNVRRSETIEIEQRDTVSRVGKRKTERHVNTTTEWTENGRRRVSRNLLEFQERRPYVDKLEKEK